MLAINWLALLVVLVCFLFVLLYRGIRNPVNGRALLFPQASALTRTRSWRLLAVRSVGPLLLLSGLFLAIALLQPQWQTPEKRANLGPSYSEREEEVEVPSEGIALYLLCDVSSSMQEAMRVKTDAGTRAIRRIDCLKAQVSTFIKKRPGDMLGLVGFARVSDVLSPLTLDHERLQEQVKTLDVVTESEQDGTAIAYALFKTANQIDATRRFSKELPDSKKPAYDITSAAIVCVTDGFSMPNQLDSAHPLRTMPLSEAGKFCKEKDIKVYIVNLEPAIANPAYREQLEALQSCAQMTGGAFYLAPDGPSLSAVLSDIDRLERSLLPSGQKALATVKESRTVAAEIYTVTELYPYFIAAAALALLAAFSFKFAWHTA